MEGSNQHTGWQLGERLLLDEGQRAVTVEDMCGNRVCCSWEQEGVTRRSWIADERLRRIAHSVEAPGGPA